jgi:hypothetical protein
MSIFDWCKHGNHEDCIRRYQRHYTDPKTNKIVLLDEWKECLCKNKKCPCSEHEGVYVAPKQRKRK